MSTYATTSINDAFWRVCPPAQRYPRQTTFKRRGWYYGRAYRVTRVATMSNGERVVIRHDSGHTTGRYQRTNKGKTS